jgi:tetratricopeptide (TPR) repeat protein
MIKTNIILRSAFATISRWKFLDGPRRRRKSLAWLSTLIFLYGCVTSEMQLGRHSLFNNKPDEALTRFQRVAEMDPNYVNRYYEEGVWTYVGRAQYLTGKLPEARQSLEKALSQHGQDYFARLYLGLTLARSGDRSAGLKEIESGIKGIHQANESMREQSNFELWDQQKVMRKETESILAMISNKDFDWDHLISSCEWLGNKFEEELDLAMEDEQIDNSPRW